MRLKFLPISIVAALCATPVLPAMAANPIHVTSCQASPPAPSGEFVDVYGHPQHQPGLEGRLDITFANTGPKTAASIEFGLVAGGGVVAQVKDKGSFAPGAKISQTFGLNGGAFPLPPGQPHCTALRVTWADGSPSWINPNLPKLMSVP